MHQRMTCHVARRGRPTRRAGVFGAAPRNGTFCRAPSASHDVNVVRSQYFFRRIPIGGSRT